MTALAWDDYARGGDADTGVWFGAENETPAARGRRVSVAWDAYAARPGADLSLFFPPSEDRDWTDQALCASADPEAFFPDKGESTRPAKQVCRRCPVRGECLEYALETEARLGTAHVWGVWGGLSVRERLALLQKRRAASTSTITQSGEAA